MTGTDGMPPGGNIEVVGEVHGLRAARSAELSAAGIERVQHDDGWRGARRRKGDVFGAPLHPQLVVERAADRSSGRSADDVFGAALAVAALRQIEVADAQVVERPVIALNLGAHHQRFGQHVLEARGRVERVVRFADRVREEARRQRRNDRFRIVGVDAVDRHRD
jgi:hypothetical protein